MTKPGKDMRAAIATAHSAAYYAAIKERTGVMPKGLSKIERAELKARVAEQLKYYDAFAEQAGDMSEAAVAARAQMYAGAIRGTYFQSRYPGLSQYPGDGSTQCLTNCKCNLDERDDGIYWVLNAGESCGDCETMAANSPYGLDETKAVKAQTDQERAMFARMDGGKGPGKGYDKSKSVLTTHKDDKAKGGGSSGGGSSSSHPPIPELKPGERRGPEVFAARDAALKSRSDARKAEVAKQGDPPKITNGSDKQQKFAHDVRARQLRDVEKQRQSFLEEGVNRGAQNTDAELKKFDAAIDKLRQRSDAKWWIDNRDTSARSLIRMHVEG